MPVKVLPLPHFGFLEICMHQVDWMFGLRSKTDRSLLNTSIEMIVND